MNNFTKYTYYTADVFTDQAFHGVPLPVFPDASGLTDEQMQKISNELNTTSTIFLLPANEENSRNIRVFSKDK